MIHGYKIRVNSREIFMLQWHFRLFPLCNRKGQQNKFYINYLKVQFIYILAYLINHIIIGLLWNFKKLTLSSNKTEKKTPSCQGQKNIFQECRNFKMNFYKQNLLQKKVT